MSSKLVIFDMDGTLIDSMPYWAHLGRNFLAKKGIEAKDGFEEIIDPMTLAEAAEYMQAEYGIEGSVDEIVAEVMQTIILAYQFEIPPKAGMKLKIKAEKDAGNTVVLFTTSDEACVKGAMRRTGMLRYFDDIILTDEIGISKHNPASYIAVCEKYGVDPQETHVYEDALYAIEGAKAAGCYVTAVYDESVKECWQDIVELSDEQITF